MWFLKASATYEGILVLANLFCAYMYPCFFTIFCSGLLTGIWLWMVYDVLIEKWDGEYEEGEEE